MTGEALWPCHRSTCMISAACVLAACPFGFNAWGVPKAKAHDCHDSVPASNLRCPPPQQMHYSHHHRDAHRAPAAHCGCLVW